MFFWYPTTVNSFHCDFNFFSSSQNSALCFSRQRIKSGAWLQYWNPIPVYSFIMWKIIWARPWTFYICTGFYKDRQHNYPQSIFLIKTEERASSFLTSVILRFSFDNKKSQGKAQDFLPQENKFISPSQEIELWFMIVRGRKSCRYLLLGTLYRAVLAIFMLPN